VATCTWRPPRAWEELDVPTHVVNRVDDGNMRFTYKFVEAMLRLWTAGLRQMAVCHVISSS